MNCAAQARLFTKTLSNRHLITTRFNFQLKKGTDLFNSIGPFPFQSSQYMTRFIPKFDYIKANSESRVDHALRFWRDSYPPNGPLFTCSPFFAQEGGLDMPKVMILPPLMMQLNCLLSLVFSNT